MELRSLLNYKSSFQLLRLTVLAVIVACLISLIVGYYIMVNKILEVRNQVVVIDNSGEVYKTSMMLGRNTRIYEYNNHVKTFFRLWYAFDEGSFDYNIEIALNLIGDSGIELLDKYIMQNIERNIKEKNIVFSVEIKDIQIDMSTLPVTGYIEGIQTISRNRGKVQRNLVCTFIVYDVDRTELNPHGCKVDMWEEEWEEVK